MARGFPPAREWQQCICIFQKLFVPLYHRNDSENATRLQTYRHNNHANLLSYSNQWLEFDWASLLDKEPKLFVFVEPKCELWCGLLFRRIALFARIELLQKHQPFHADRCWFFLDTALFWHWNLSCFLSLTFVSCTTSNLPTLWHVALLGFP